MRCMDGFSFLALVPYMRIYRRNTRDPVFSIARETDEEQVQDTVSEFFRLKTAEAKYVQVAVFDVASSTSTEMTDVL